MYELFRDMVSAFGFTYLYCQKMIYIELWTGFSVCSSKKIFRENLLFVNMCNDCITLTLGT